jgi:hypothetical protein
VKSPTSTSTKYLTSLISLYPTAASAATLSNEERQNSANVNPRSWPPKISYLYTSLFFFYFFTVYYTPLEYISFFPPPLSNTSLTSIRPLPPHGRPSVGLGSPDLHIIYYIVPLNGVTTTVSEMSRSPGTQLCSIPAAIPSYSVSAHSSWNDGSRLIPRRGIGIMSMWGRIQRCSPRKPKHSRYCRHPWFSVMSYSTPNLRVVLHSAYPLSAKLTLSPAHQPAALAAHKHELLFLLNPVRLRSSRFFHFHFHSSLTPCDSGDVNVSHKVHDDLVTIAALLWRHMPFVHIIAVSCTIIGSTYTGHELLDTSWSEKKDQRIQRCQIRYRNSSRNA